MDERAGLANVVCDLLGEQDAGNLTALLSEMEYRKLQPGETLIGNSETGDRMFVVVTGRLRIAAEAADGTEQLVDELSQGDAIGEKIILESGIPSVRVYALEDSAVGVISRVLFENIKFQYPEVITRLTQVAYRRMQAYTARRMGTSVVTAALSYNTHGANVAVVPVGSPPGKVPRQRFCDRLVASLPPIWNTLLLSSARVDSLLGKAGIAQSGPQDPAEPLLASWLAEQEQGHFCVIYEADEGWTPWTERCLRKADRVLLVGMGDSRPVPGEVDESLQLRSDATVTMLVLLQPEAQPYPTGTAAWLDQYEVSRHNHVRLNRVADFEAFVRRITGQGLGLVLGGGGARGLAHAGVFRALEECGVEVDLVGGTSIGAVLGGLFAMGLDARATLELAREIASPLKLFDPTVPVVSFFASGKVTKVLERIYGDLQIEDLWMPFYCVSSNLTHAVSVVHRRGALWQAVRASSAIPGIFSPVLSNGDLLVDGCVLDNLPIDVMQRMNFSGPIIAVNVFPDEDLVRPYSFGPSVSGWRAIANKLNPLRGAEGPPLIFESLVRVLALNSVHQVQTQRGFTDVYIRPPVEKFNILDFGAYAQIAEIGYQSALEALCDWEGLPQASPVRKASLTKARPAARGKVVAQLDQTLTELEAVLGRLENPGRNRG